LIGSSINSAVNQASFNQIRPVRQSIKYPANQSGYLIVGSTVYCVRLERYYSTAGVAAEVAAGVLPGGCWMLICMLRRVLDGGLLLRCVTTLGYCIKLLGNWILGAVKAGVLYTAKALP
jgi:hypothetical protein